MEVAMGCPLEDLGNATYSYIDVNPLILHNSSTLKANCTTGGGMDNLTSLNESFTNQGNTMQQVYGSRLVPYTTLSAAALVFNSLSISAMLRIRGHRTVHHTLLLNLAVCDIIGSVLLWMYYNSPVIFPRFQITNLGHCLFIVIALVAPFVLSLCSSSLSLLALALNQYIAICDPLFSATKITRGTACICIFIIWCISGLCASIPAMVVLVKNQSEHCPFYINDMSVKSVEICSYALAGLILIIVGLYGRIYREVILFRQRAPQLRTPHLPNRPSGRGDEAEHNYKAFITTLLLSGTLVIFWLPYLTFHFISAHLDVEYMSDLVVNIKLYVIDFLPMLNFLTDPIIYGIRMREIREGYHRLFAKIFPFCIDEPVNQNRNRTSVRFTTLDTSV